MLTATHTATAVSQIGLLAGLYLSVKHYNKINNNLSRAWLYSQNKENDAAFLETVHFKSHKEYFIKVLEKHIKDLEEKKIKPSKKFHISHLLLALVCWSLHREVVNLWIYLDFESRIQEIKDSAEPSMLVKSLGMACITVALVITDFIVLIKSLKNVWSGITYRRSIDSKIMRDHKILEIIKQDSSL